MPMMRLDTKQPETWGNKDLATVLNDARSILFIQGLLPARENERVKTRLDKRAAKEGYNPHAHR